MSSNIVDLTAEDGSRQSPAKFNCRLQYPNWCFTYHYGGANQPDRDACERFLCALTEKAGYVIAGFESAPSTSQLHAQGYVQLLRRARVTELKKIPDGSTVHWAPAHGDEVQNRKYCTKSCVDDFYETGEAKEINPGARETKRWSEARRASVENRMEDIPDQIFVQHYSAIKLIARDHLKLPKDADGCTGLWVYGVTGAGKSRYVRDTFTDIYMKPINKWWDGYQNQKHVLLDDFGKEHSVLGYHLKIWGDRYAFPGEVKGSTICLRPETVIVTSQYHPRDIWGSDPESLDALLRRFRLLYIGDPENNPWEATLNLPPSTVVSLSSEVPMDVESKVTEN